MTIWITTNGRPSNSAKILSEQQGFARAVQGKKIKPNDLLVNWGSSSPLNLKVLPNTIYNLPERILIASNKLKSFEILFGEVLLPQYTTKQEEAQKWSNDNHCVIVRTKLTGHSGDGIIIVEKGEEVPPAPLYTQYLFKEKEFRVHVVNGEVIDTQRKIRDPDREPVNWKIRSHQNGFIFARNNIEKDAERDDISCKAVKALGLNFGAVDLIQDKNGIYYVLEVNTAPGLEGITVEKYVEAFRASQA